MKRCETAPTTTNTHNNKCWAMDTDLFIFNVNHRRFIFITYISAYNRFTLTYQISYVCSMCPSALNVNKITIEWNWYTNDFLFCTKHETIRNENRMCDGIRFGNVIKKRGRRKISESKMDGKLKEWIML